MRKEGENCQKLKGKNEQTGYFFISKQALFYSSFKYVFIAPSDSRYTQVGFNIIRGVAAGRAGRARALPIFWQETAVTVTS